MTENHGIQNIHSMVNGPQAAGPFASAEQTVNYPSAPAPWPSADAEALADAAESLRAELSRLRAEEPQAVTDTDAATAEIQLASITHIAATPTPNHEVLKRRISMIKEALSEASTLTAALAALETAIRKLIGAS